MRWVKRPFLLQARRRRTHLFVRVQETDSVASRVATSADAHAPSGQSRSLMKNSWRSSALRVLLREADGSTLARRLLWGIGAARWALRSAKAQTRHSRWKRQRGMRAKTPCGRT